MTVWWLMLLITKRRIIQNVDVSVLRCPGFYQVDGRMCDSRVLMKKAIDAHRKQFWLLLKLCCNKLHEKPFLYVRRTATFQSLFSGVRWHRPNAYWRRIRYKWYIRYNEKTESTLFVCKFCISVMLTHQWCLFCTTGLCLLSLWFHICRCLSYRIH